MRKQWSKMKKNNELILIGQVTGTFGIKGELKVYSESDFVEYRYRVGAKIIFSDKSVHKVSSCRFHKGNVLITIDELYNINFVYLRCEHKDGEFYFC